MILVTVGMQLGFDRLIEAMDALAPTLGTPVIAQIGRGEYQPVNMATHIAIEPREFERLVMQSQLVVSHAGIGTVLTARRCGKAIVLMPRQARLGEHRSDHQLATCTQLEGRPGIFVASEADDLAKQIALAVADKQGNQESSPDLAMLRSSVAKFIENGRV